MIKPATTRLCTKKCPRTTTAMAPAARIRVPDVTYPMRSCLASLLRSVSRTADAGTDAMMACQVGVSSLVASGVATGSSNSSLSTVSPGTGIGGSAIRATATVSLAAFVTMNSPNAIPPAGTQSWYP
ncbi:Uncharacterised protein [Mycobacterium tuberculosis]|nr:Uncharacterised protein [Mycobacterium tuberculosis]COZ36799.1 Uncharacterised protein [Mycobacterium tuberculosis]